jgi:hypothetical protein
MMGVREVRRERGGTTAAREYAILLCNGELEY